MSLLILCLLCFNIAVANTSKHHICFLTLNSTDEKNEFKRYLGNEYFEYTEIVPNGAQSSLPSDWFTSQCAKITRPCDAMILSGHYGGELFFGQSRENGAKLFLKDLEDSSCQNLCGNILSAPVNIFLYGCNTLATKEADERTLDQYVQALEHSNIAHADAIRIANLRYGPIGFSFKERMKHIFNQSGEVFGFATKIPVGNVLKNNVRSYLKTKTPQQWHRHFSELKTTKSFLNSSPILPVALMERYQSSFKDDDFLKSHSQFQSRQINTLSRLPDDQKERKYLCQVKDEATWYSTRMEIFAEIITTESKNFILKFLPIMEDFFRRYPPFRFDPKAEKIIHLYDMREHSAHQALKASSKSSKSFSQTIEMVSAMPVDIYKFQLSTIFIHLEILQDHDLFPMVDSLLEKLYSQEAVDTETIYRLCNYKHLLTNYQLDPIFLNLETYKLKPTLIPLLGCFSGTQNILNKLLIDKNKEIFNFSLDAISFVGQKPFTETLIKLSRSNEKRLSILKTLRVTGTHNDPLWQTELAKMYTHLPAEHQAIIRSIPGFRL